MSPRDALHRSLAPMLSAPLGRVAAALSGLALAVLLLLIIPVAWRGAMATIALTTAGLGLWELGTSGRWRSAESTAAPAGCGIDDAAAFTRFVDAALARPNPRLGLLYLQLRQVSLLRATFGREPVEALFAAVARRLRDQIRADDALAHLGDGLFAIALPGIADRATFDAVAGRLRADVAAPLLVVGARLDPTFDMAAVLAPDDGATAAELLAAGEASREWAKTKPGEAVRWLAPSSGGEVAQRRARLRELLEAKDSRAFFPVFQPQLDLVTGRIDRAEVLMRWQRADGKIAGPAQFLSELGEMGALPAVSREVYAAALAEAGVCRANGCGLERIALNLDATQVTGEDWADVLLEQVERSALPATAVEFEVSENILKHADLAVLTRGLQQLRDAGVGVSLDDFGKGFASLTQIANLPIDLVKIDARLLWDAADGGRPLAVLEGTVALMSRLGLPCVFEGIETPAHLDLARRLDGRVAQGFLIGRPMPAPQFEALLAGQAPPLPQDVRWRAASPRMTSGAKPARITTPSTT